MSANGSMGWGWIFLALALILGWIAASPRRRQMLRWGRTASAVPMSAVGVFAWIGAFLLIAAAGFGFLPLVFIFGVVPALAIAGCYDSYRTSRKKKQPSDPSSRQG